MALIKYLNKNKNRVYVTDLKLKDTFKLTTGNTVYMLVQDVHGKRFMLELDTGKCFPLSLSPVELVDVVIEVYN